MRWSSREEGERRRGGGEGTSGGEVSEGGGWEKGGGWGVEEVIDGGGRERERGGVRVRSE